MRWHEMGWNDMRCVGMIWDGAVGKCVARALLILVWAEIGKR